MPIVRKVEPAIGATWEPEDDTKRDPAELLAALAGNDRRGITRMDYDRDGSHGWMARVYSGGATITRYYADGTYGGMEAALQRALAWRDAQRQHITPRQRSSKRITRIDRPAWHNVGWFAWVEGQRRYFSDAAHGGPDGAKAAAEAWINGSYEKEHNEARAAGED